MKGEQLSFLETINNKCESCTYFKIDKKFYSIDCLNKDIDQENYFKYLGEGEKGCPYYKSV